MYINGIGHYVSEQRVTNDYFEGINGLDADWIHRRTGISSRSKISKNEGDLVGITVFGGGYSSGAMLIRF